MRQVNIKIEEELLDRIDTLVDKSGKNRSQYMIDKALEEDIPDIENNIESESTIKILTDQVDYLKEQLKIKDEQLERSDILLKESLDLKNNLLLTHKQHWWQRLFRYKS
jgi:ribbon-helix-helix protein, copG family